MLAAVPFGAALASQPTPDAQVWMASPASQLPNDVLVGWATEPGAQVLEVQWALLSGGTVVEESGVSLSGGSDSGSIGVESFAGGGWLDDGVYMERALVFFELPPGTVGQAEVTRPVRLRSGIFEEISQKDYDWEVTPTTIGASGQTEIRGTSIPKSRGPSSDFEPSTVLDMMVDP